MIKIKKSAIFILCVITFFSCTGNNTAIIPIPPSEYFVQEKIMILIENIIETKDGSSADSLPVWLAAFIDGGIEEVERMYIYYDKYAFVGVNEGTNFGALEMWADNFSTVHDFTMLAAQRIQRRMLSTASLYPDDEYGAFFEKMIKNAYGTVYPGAKKEDVYWVKLKVNNENNELDPQMTDALASSEVYNYFILVIIDKMIMRDIISNILGETYSSVTPNASQRSSVNRLRQTFFEGF